MQNSAEESTGSHEAKTLSGLKEVCHVLNPTKAWLTFCRDTSHGSNQFGHISVNQWHLEHLFPGWSLMAQYYHLKCQLENVVLTWLTSFSGCWRSCPWWSLAWGWSRPAPPWCGAPWWWVKCPHWSLPQQPAQLSPRVKSMQRSTSRPPWLRSHLNWGGEGGGSFLGTSPAGRAVPYHTAAS